MLSLREIRTARCAPFISRPFARTRATQIFQIRKFFGPRAIAKNIFHFASVVFFFFAFATAGAADSNSFDLLGPRLEVKVTRKGVPLPISEVANLQPGDRIWLHPDFPDDQSARYLLIVAFLRGATNPPPENWFIKIETWTKQAREEGTVVTVPQDAQQALLFLAPETGGDFGTLRGAVRGRPGIFVRAAQDLNQASLDRSRLEKYLTEVKAISDTDPKALREHSVLMARALGIRLEQQCFDKPVEEQGACLTRNTDNLVMDDGHSQSLVTALASGPNSDLVGAVSATPIAGGGFYSAYVGAVVDLARVLGNLHTASYVYIPALALPKGEQMNLRLNNPPSFRKPMSVIVVGLPAIEEAHLPMLRAVNSGQIFCLQKSSLILPVQGAPLVFSSDIAHDFFLQIPNPNKDEKDLKLSAVADATSGGFVVDTHAVEGLKLDPEVTGTLHGSWGFDAYEGLKFRLRTSRSSQWGLNAAEQTGLIVGREDTLHLRSESAVCVDEINIQDAQGKEIKNTWRITKPDELELKIGLKDQPAGALVVKLKQYGLPQRDEVKLTTYFEAARLDSFSINAGDQQGVLRGTRLDEVEHFVMNGVQFLPVKLTRANDVDELHLSEIQPDSVALQPDQKVVAHVSLKDGRKLDLPTIVGAPRPKISLVNRNIQMGDATPNITLGGHEELPLDGQISFLLKTEIPEKFPRSERIEIATVDEAFSVQLSVEDGTLILRDAESVFATFSPAKSFGPSAFGALRFRPVMGDGTKGDWQLLAHLVRVPVLKELRCPKKGDKPCHLSGTNLFLIDAVATDQEFLHTSPVPTDFIDSTLQVPRPSESGLYFKLRDDPSATNTITLPVQLEK